MICVCYQQEETCERDRLKMRKLWMDDALLMHSARD
jgi:hypothetical protein